MIEYELKSDSFLTTNARTQRRVPLRFFILQRLLPSAKSIFRHLFFLLSSPRILLYLDPMSTELILIRHGETEWNATGRIQGHREVSLNDRGQKQAQAVADRLKNESFNALYSSDLKRTLQTAEAISQCTGHTIQTDSRLREWDLGILAGLTCADAETQHPKAYAIYHNSRVDDPVPEGESIRNRATRITTCIEEIASNHKDERIVVITHGGPLGDCYRQAVGLSIDQPLDVELYNAGLNTFAIAGSNWTLKTWGDIAHLEGIGSMGDWEGRK